MRVMRNTNQILRINRNVRKINEIIEDYRIHVVNYYPTKNRPVFYTKIATVIAQYYLVTNAFPCLRSVEFLIKKTVKPKCIGSDRSVYS